ncbi:hypothetical protein [Streptomyces rubiginosohelvolus]|uniref:Secreted protein n=1 Tax=Streptomyces rubiginosohelvolus TaxID=67362 RepID=A0ABQ3BSP6_9ACTN|nr:hypothetical protein [Streptomyces pluricolorescens]GGZ53161.1 hypothetical protein GCM10010328_29970 [Streptomyces pluricolorescens]
MRARTALTAVTAAALLALAGCSSDYTADDCAAAINGTSTKTNRPTECQDIPADDYETILLNQAVKEAINGLDQDDQDLLDYHDDGSLNESIGGDD